MLTRDEALKLCETLLAHAKSAGAEDAAVTVNGTTESHARFADNRITTSGTSEDLALALDVWVGRRRGSVSGNDGGADALKRMAADEGGEVAELPSEHPTSIPIPEYQNGVLPLESLPGAAAVAYLDFDAPAADGAAARRADRGLPPHDLRGHGRSR